MLSNRMFLVAVLASLFALRASAQPLNEPQSFLYYAVWDSTEGTFIRSTVQRIQMSHTDYDDLKAKFVDEFVKQTQVPGAAPGQPAPAAAAPGGPAEIRLALATKASAGEAPPPALGPAGNEAPVVLAFDSGPTRNSISKGSDARALGEWTFYFWQMRLWEYYVAHDTLNKTEDLTLADVDQLVAEIDKKREPVWVWTEIDPATDEPKEWVQVDREFPPLEKPTEEEVSAVNSLRKTVWSIQDEQKNWVASSAQGRMFAPQYPPAHGIDQLEAKGLYRIYKECAYAIDAQDHDRYFGLLNRLRDRQQARNRYREWVADRHGIVIKFAQEWARKFDGTELDIDGIMYLVAKPGETKPSVPLEGRLIEVDRVDVVTPYDLLEDNGTLKRPVPIED